MGEDVDFRYKLLLASLLKTRLTRTQARRLLGRSFKFYREVLGELKKRGIIGEKRYSVATIISHGVFRGDGLRSAIM